MAPSDLDQKTKRGAGERRRLEVEAWRLMNELVWSQRPQVMALCREFELFPPQLMVLRALDEPRPMREVAAHLACDSSNLTGITDRLEERGLVRRTADANDRRVKLLVLTDAGQRMRKEIVARMGVPPESIGALSDRDLEAIGRALGKALPAG
ncbi:MAG TPA: MarR family transcriptional regulator [Solirubrobacterales bacterium]